MTSSPHFNFKDVLWAPARALSAKQILVMTIFLAVGLALYDLFVYLAYAAQGSDLGQVFDVYGFFPFETADFDGVIAQGLFWAGVSLGVLALMLGMFGVAAINIEEVRGNRFMGFRDAIRFALRRLPQMFLAELSIILFVLFIVVLFSLLGLASRIPWVGEWLYTIFFALPNFVVALLTVFIVFVLTLTVLLMPAVAAAERRGETFTAILETFSTIILQPFRWAGYTLYSLGAAKVCSFVFAYFVFRAVEFMTWSSTLGGGERLTRLVKSGLAHLPIGSDAVRELFNIFPGVSFGVDVTRFVGYPSAEAITHLMAFMLFLIFLTIVGYMLAIVAAGQARGYVALRKIKDQYDITTEAPLFFTDQPVNEKVEGEGESTN